MYTLRNVILGQELSHCKNKTIPIGEGLEYLQIGIRSSATACLYIFDQVLNNIDSGFR